MKFELLRDREVAAMLHIGTTSVWNWSRAGILPTPVRVGPRTTRWRSDQVRAFIERQQKTVS